MSSKASIYGFAILRNGVKYDYPFKECLQSMNGVCKFTHLALGKSDDGTESKIDEIKDSLNLKITNTIWDDQKRSGGLILSEQTNIALDSLRSDINKDRSDFLNAWGLYLQCDEVISERDFELLKCDIQKANDQGLDAISFRYLHFWQTHHQVAINKKWYPQEIRAVKLDSPAKSWGDAQSFLNTNKVFHSEVIVYHYGHVREEDKYLEKKKDILKFYHTDEKMKKYKKREKRFDNQTECLNYFGYHPKFMHNRIAKHKDENFFEKEKRVYIVAKEIHLSDDFLSRINADKVYVVSSLFEVPIADRNKMIIVKPNWFQKIWYGIKTPNKMKSKLALSWNNEFRVMMMLFEKGISVN